MMVAFKHWSILWVSKYGSSWSDLFCEATTLRPLWRSLWPSSKQTVLKISFADPLCRFCASWNQHVHLLIILILWVLGLREMQVVAMARLGEQHFSFLEQTMLADLWCWCRLCFGCLRALIYTLGQQMVALGLICSVRRQHLALFEGHCDSSLNRQFRRHHLLIHCADCVCMVSWTKWWHSLRWVSLLMLPMRKVSWVGTLYRYMTWGCSNWFKMCNFPVCLLLPSALEECHHCS